LLPIGFIIYNSLKAILFLIRKLLIKALGKTTMRKPPKNQEAATGKKPGKPLVLKTYHMGGSRDTYRRKDIYKDL
jgi:hypothetical protein